jgi:hypothetical protein
MLLPERALPRHADFHFISPNLQIVMIIAVRHCEERSDEAIQ